MTMPIQKRKHEVTVGMIREIDDFYKQCLKNGMSSAATTKCQEKFEITKAYVGQARKIRPYLTADNQELCNLLDDQKICADTCLTIVQCFDANQDRFSNLEDLVDEILQDGNIRQTIEEGRPLSKDRFVKWRDERRLKLGRIRYQQEIKTTIDENGKLTIPSKYRQALGLQAGDEVTLRLETGGVRVLIPSVPVQ
jgi:AbrB family looped-hinge helix DNA binding protein